MVFKKLKNIGPGAMVAAAFIGPGTVTTATIAGAGYGFTLLWAILFSVFATYVLQEMAARLGVAGRKGLGEALRQKSTNRLVFIGVAVLVLGAILIGNAAYEAGNISGAVLGLGEMGNPIPGLSFNPYILLIGGLAFYILFTAKYRVIERSLVAMVSIMGFVFLLTAIALGPDPVDVLAGLFRPVIPEGALLMVVGLIGTTVVPYNLFLHASSVKTKWDSADDLVVCRWDTLISVVFGGMITMSILICSAIAFEGLNGQINDASDLAFQLKPILGQASGAFIAVGFLAAGLSSSVTAPLAAAYATSEMLGWKGGMSSWRFRSIWGFVLISGIVFSTLGFRPTAVIFFAQVANGILLPVIAAFLVWIMNDRALMGDHVNSRFVNVLGFVIIIVTFLLGLRGILSAFGIL